MSATSGCYRALLASVAVGSVISGCGVAAVETYGHIATANLPKSKFAPIYSTEAGLDQHLAFLKEHDKKVARDETGVIYTEFKTTDHIVNVYLNKEDEVALKSLTASAVGLLEPAYTFNQNTALIYDEAETVRRHGYLTKSVGLKLLPLDATRRYRLQVEKLARNDAAKQMARNSNTIGLLTQPITGGAAAFAGELGLYSSRYYAEVLAPIGGDFAYVVIDPVTAMLYQDLLVGAMIDLAPPQARQHIEESRKAEIVGRVNGLTNGWGGMTTASIQFVPVEYYKTLKAGGAFRSNSGCRSWSIAAAREGLREFRKQSDIPYASAIISSIQARQQDNIDAARRKLETFKSELPAKRRDAEAACLAGLRALNVAGVLSSKRL